MAEQDGHVAGCSLARTLGVMPRDEGQILSPIQGRETFTVAASIVPGMS
jgi:hypothetical protein